MTSKKKVKAAKKALKKQKTVHVPSKPKPLVTSDAAKPELFRLFACAEYGCFKHWWASQDEAEVTTAHQCTAKDLEKRKNPTVVTFLAQSRETVVTDTQPVVPLRAGERKHGTDGV